MSNDYNIAVRKLIAALTKSLNKNGIKTLEKPRWPPGSPLATKQLLPEKEVVTQVTTVTHTTSDPVIHHREEELNVLVRPEKKKLDNIEKSSKF